MIRCYSNINLTLFFYSHRGSSYFLYCKVSRRNIQPSSFHLVWCCFNTLSHLVCIALSLILLYVDVAAVKGHAVISVEIFINSIIFRQNMLQKYFIYIYFTRNKNVFLCHSVYFLLI